VAYLKKNKVNPAEYHFKRDLSPGVESLPGNSEGAERIVLNPEKIFYFQKFWQAQASAYEKGA